jgi:hypothetical protein
MLKRSSDKCKIICHKSINKAVFDFHPKYNTYRQKATNEKVIFGHWPMSNFLDTLKVKIKEYLMRTGPF